MDKVKVGDIVETVVGSYFRAKGNRKVIDINDKFVVMELCESNDVGEMHVPHSLFNTSMFKIIQ